MTDNEIIKAYGCCNLNYDECGGCESCPLRTIEKNCRVAEQDFDLEREVYNLLNRQKAEIDRLDSELKATSGAALSYKAEIERLTGKRNADPMDFCGVLCRYSEELITKAKAEVVKEFAERFENELTKIEEIYFDEEHENFISANKVIALLVNLVKEMVGEG